MVQRNHWIIPVVIRFLLGLGFFSTVEEEIQKPGHWFISIFIRKNDFLRDILLSMFDCQVQVWYQRGGRFGRQGLVVRVWWSFKFAKIRDDPRVPNDHWGNPLIFLWLLHVGYIFIKYRSIYEYNHQKKDIFWRYFLSIVSCQIPVFCKEGVIFGRKGLVVKVWW